MYLRLGTSREQGWLDSVQGKRGEAAYGRSPQCSLCLLPNLRLNQDRRNYDSQYAALLESAAHWLFPFTIHQEDIIMKKSSMRDKGQGLVEYALILVLVAIVVLAILLLLGPVVGNVFSNVVAVLQKAGMAGDGSGVITSVTAGEFLGTVTVNVQVSTSTTVSLSGDVSHSGKSCPGSCTFSLSGPTHGTVTATAAAGGQKTATW
jgi:pilus assembly protein Flp/PilA